MAYEITVEEDLRIEPPLNAEEIAYLQAFNLTRRVLRERGPYAVHDTESGTAPRKPTGATADVLDDNQPAEGQPSLWCPWTVSDDGTALRWDGFVSSHSHIEWLEYLIEHFLTGRALSQRDVERAGESERFQGFSFDHRVHGTAEFLGEDGEGWAVTVDGDQLTYHRLVYRYEPPLRLAADRSSA